MLHWLSDVTLKTELTAASTEVLHKKQKLLKKKKERLQLQYTLHFNSNSEISININAVRTEC